MSTHVMRTKSDAEGWWYFTCSCGCDVGPFPDEESAEDEATWHEENCKA